MEIRDVGSNSFRSKEKSADDTQRTPKMKKVADGVKVKPSATTKLVDIFFPDGLNPEDIWEYLLKEKIAPGIRRGVRGFFDDLLDATFGTDTGRKRDDGYYRSSRHTPYSSLYKSSNDDSRERERNKDKDRWKKKPSTYAEVAFRTRAEAEEVLDAMQDALDTFHIVSVADLYEMSGEKPEPTDYNYGWLSLKTARVEKVGNAYTLVMPKATPID